MYNPIEVNKNDFIKYLKCVYLVKNFTKLDNGYYRLSFYFRSIVKDNAKLHNNKYYDISGYQTEKIKKASRKECEFLISQIKKAQPDFDVARFHQNAISDENDLHEQECVEYLKSRGYIIYKQM